jgi:hypothetical protein
MENPPKSPFFKEPVGRESEAHPAFSIIIFRRRSNSVTVKKEVPD